MQMQKLQCNSNEYKDCESLVNSLNNIWETRVGKKKVLYVFEVSTLGGGRAPRSFPPCRRLRIIIGDVVQHIRVVEFGHYLANSMRA
jgi:hypothetical protein